MQIKKNMHMISRCQIMLPLVALFDNMLKSAKKIVKAHLMIYKLL